MAVAPYFGRKIHDTSISRDASLGTMPSFNLGHRESLNAGTEYAAVAVGQSRNFDKEELSSQMLF